MTIEAKNLTKEQLLVLADAHITRFERMLKQFEAKVPGIRGNECKAYLETWTQVRSDVEFGDLFDKLEPDGKAEILDALSIGDFDEVLERLSKPKTETKTAGDTWP